MPPIQPPEPNLASPSPDDAARFAAIRQYQILDTPPEIAFDRITSLASRLLAAPVVLITLVDSDRQWFKSHHGVDITQTGLDVSFCVQAIKSNGVMVVPDATKDGRFSAMAVVSGPPHIRFYAGAPLRTPEGVALGTLCVLGFETREWTDEQSAILSDLAAIVVDEMELRSAGQRFEREATERGVAEAALRETEGRLQLAMESGQMGLWNVDLSTGHIVWSPEMETLHDIPVGSFDGRFESFLGLLHPDDHERLTRLSTQDIADGRGFLVEYRIPWSDGSLHWLETHGSPVGGDEGTAAKRLMGVTLDITARKLSEAALRQSEERFKSAFQYSAIGMALLSVEGKWLQVNDQLCEILGYSASELTTLTFQDVTYPDDLEADLALVEQLLAGEIQSYEMEKRYFHRDGHVVWCLLDVSLVRDEAEAPLYFISQIQDISARKVVEDDLRESEMRKSAILENALDCIVTIDAQGTVLEWNPAAERTFGYSREEILGKEMAEFIIPPELRDSHRKGISHYLATGEGPVLHQRIELPAIRADGSALMVEVAIVPIPGTSPPLFTGHLRDIGERKRTEERLRLLESVVVNANDAILITEAEPFDLPGPRILYVNEAFTHMTGYSADEVLGKTPRILQGDGTSAEARAKIRSALDAWQPVVVELLNYKKDGTPFWVELSIVPVPDTSGWYTHWVAIERDITDRKEISDALSESEERYGRIAANVPGMVYQCLLGADGKISFPFVSEGSREIYHLDPEEIMRDSSVILQAVHPEDSSGFYRSILESAAKLEPWEWEGRIVMSEGDTKWVHGISRPTREETDIVWDGLLFDITQRKGEEEALQRAKLEAEVAREEAERANHAKSDFLGRMSHELRTPLNAILGFGQLLEMSPLNEDDAQSATQIVKAGRHLLDLINEVLDIARIESGRLELSPEPVDVRHIGLEVLDLVRPLAASRGIIFDESSIRLCEAHIKADRQRLKQVLLNLLANAVKYNREGGIVTFGSQLHTTPDGDVMVRISVRDTGKGIAPELLSRLFTPFDRLGAESSGVEGTGVGLALSRRLAEAMGGVLGVETEVGKGCTFWIELPTALNPLQNLTPLAAATVDPGVVSTRLLLLYIEDNPSNLQLVQRLLAHRPEIRLLTAMQGGLGQELARQHHPDLILLDMNLPDGPGQDVLQRLREDDKTSSIPIVVVSADATSSQITRALEAGAQQYLTKPFDVREFWAILDKRMRAEEIL